MNEKGIMRRYKTRRFSLFVSKEYKMEVSIKEEQ
jgi:hypothetical protein